MNSKIKNAIIFIVIGGALFAVYFFFVKPKPQEANLVTTSTQSTDTNVVPDTTGQLSTANSEIAKELVVVLLDVKNITLNDAILTDPAFKNLVDSTVTLIPEKNEGRPNPFAPIGSDVVASPVAPVSAGSLVPVVPLDSGATTPTTNNNSVAPGATIPPVSTN